MSGGLERLAEELRATPEGDARHLEAQTLAGLVGAAAEALKAADTIAEAIALAALLGLSQGYGWTVDKRGIALRDAAGRWIVKPPRRSLRLR
jgi:hypothetical protein